MADLYVRSSGGSDADNGSTWALAKATLAGAAAIDAAGDRIFLASTHSETTGSALAFAIAGTIASPTLVMSVSDADEPPTTPSAGASITTTGASGISFTGTGIYVEGITFNCGTGATSTTLSACSTTTLSRTVFKNCAFVNNTSGASSRVAPLGATAAHTTWLNCTVRFSSAGSGVGLGANGRFIWSGGGLASGGTSPTALVPAANAGANALLENLDLSALSSSANLAAASTGGNTRVVFRNCRLPASWTGSLCTGSPVCGDRYEMHNCDAGDTNYRLSVVDHLGTIRSETTIVRSGGATDGTTPFSWVVASNTLARFPAFALAAPELALWNDTIGTPITVTVEVVTDGVTLKDDECWLEVDYLGTSDFPLGSLASNAKANVLAAGSNVATSTTTWTTTGLTSPVKQKLSVTFTPQEAGHLQAVVRLAKASTTVYVDPCLTVT